MAPIPCNAEAGGRTAAAGLTFAFCTLLVAGCASGGPKTLYVKVEDAAFSPSNVTVAIGTTVQWYSESSVVHTITATDPSRWTSMTGGPAPDQRLSEGESWSFTFSRSGRFDYYCRPHPFMTGTVLVEGGSPDAGGATTPKPTSGDVEVSRVRA